jgi:hypothetical protein
MGQSMPKTCNNTFIKTENNLKYIKTICDDVEFNTFTFTNNNIIIKCKIYPFEVLCDKNTELKLIINI